MNLEVPIESIKGVGSVLKSNLNKLGIFTVADIIDYYPKRYEDYSDIQKISSIKPGVVTIKAVIKQASSKYVRRGMNITEAVASDESGSVRLVWFNQPYRANSIKKDTEYYIRGDFGLRRGRLSILSPTIELVSDFPVHSARIIPVYKLTKGVKSSQIRIIISKLRSSVGIVEETLPEWIIGENKLISRSDALMKLHFPDDVNDVDNAKKRLGFEEIFQLSLASEFNKLEFMAEKAPVIKFDEKLAKKFVSSLDFELTNAQKKAVWQIYKDIQNTSPMNRLLEGDVGSGKTVVACMSAIMAVNSGHQVAIMAPTEILARQHLESFKKLLKPIKMHDTVALLLGRTTKENKNKLLTDLKNNKVKIIIGTTSLIQDVVLMNNLSLIVIDEQHRFGVDQRKKLLSKSHEVPHVLSMTATPIPRSLALTLYGELDITIIDEKPANRLPILTSLVSPNSVKQMYNSIKGELDAGRQAIVVCPVIEESSEGVNSAEHVYEKLNNGEFKTYKLGILHGKQHTKIKEQVMQKFFNGEIDLLVSTTVIEVGVDVPNTTVIVVMSPEKFGLAQIHQLRGRVGRSHLQSYCYLVLSDSNSPSRRMRALATKSSGFELSELDLEIRGPGAIYGTMQHGALDLRIANLSDVKLIESAKNSAKLFIEKKEKLSNYPYLRDNVIKLRKITNLN
jgi:ATP-dependent DNA helicase RecG